MSTILTRHRINNITAYKPETIVEFESFLERIDNTHKLRELDLSKLGTDIKPEHLSSAAEKLTNLGKLNVSGCHLYPQDWTFQHINDGLTKLLESNPGIRNLDVSYCWEIDSTLAETLSTRQVEYLNVHSCYGLNEDDRENLRLKLPSAYIIDVDGQEMPGRTASFAANISRQSNSIGKR